MAISPKVRKKKHHDNSNLIILRVKSKLFAFIFQSDFFLVCMRPQQRPSTVFLFQVYLKCSAQKGVWPVQTARGRLPDPNVILSVPARTTCIHWVTASLRWPMQVVLTDLRHRCWPAPCCPDTHSPVPYPHPLLPQRSFKAYIQAPDF